MFQNVFTIQARPAHVKLRKLIISLISSFLHLSKSKYVTIFIKNISIALEKPEIINIFYRIDILDGLKE